MTNSKLIELLKTFNAQELREFKDFVASPFFNKNQELNIFFDYLKKCAPKFLDKKINSTAVYHQLFPKKKYDDKHMKYLMSFLLKLAEKYIGYKKYQDQKLLPDYHVLSSCIDRNLEKHYQQNFQKATSIIKKNSLMDTNYYYNQYLLADIANQHFLSKKIRKLDNRLQVASDFLDLYFLANKLKYSCEILDRQQTLSGEYVIGMLQEVTLYLENNNFETETTINIYYNILRVLMEDHPEPYFEKLKELLFENLEQFTKEEIQNMYFLTLNFCIRRVRKSGKKHAEELLNLYLKGIETQILFENNQLSPWTYKNVVKLGLDLNKFEWTEQFIHKYNNSLAESFQKDALQYNLADLFYYRNELGKALEHLRNVEFSDIYYALDSKVMLLKIYYELEEQESLLSLLASFKIYLKRNKLITKETQKTYGNFVNVLVTLNKKNKRDLTDLESLIKNTQFLYGRKWLLQKFEEI